LPYIGTIPSNNSRYFLPFGSLNLQSFDVERLCSLDVMRVWKPKKKILSAVFKYVE